MSNPEDLARQLEQDAKELEARHRQQQEALSQAGEEAAAVLAGGVVGGVAGAELGTGVTVGGVALGLKGAVVAGSAGALVGLAAGLALTELDRAADAEDERDAAERQAEVMERAQQIQREQGMTGPEALRQAQQEADGSS